MGLGFRVSERLTIDATKSFYQSTLTGPGRVGKIDKPFQHLSSKNPKPQNPKPQNPKPQNLKPQSPAPHNLKPQSPKPYTVLKAAPGKSTSRSISWAGVRKQLLEHEALYKCLKWVWKAAARKYSVLKGTSLSWSQLP